jgi:hypothetical protein
MCRYRELLLILRQILSQLDHNRLSAVLLVQLKDPSHFVQCYTVMITEIIDISTIASSDSWDRPVSLSFLSSLSVGFCTRFLHLFNDSGQRINQVSFPSGGANSHSGAVQPISCSILQAARATDWRAALLATPPQCCGSTHANFTTTTQPLVPAG